MLYITKAARQTGLFTAFLLGLFVLETAVVNGAEYNRVAAAQTNKAMNFREVQRDLSTDIFGQSVQDFETGETLDQGNPFYDERRWTFSWGVDMIIRFEKGYEYCTSYIIVPAENAWPAAVRGLLYMICLFYLFLGVAIISDQFMAAIEQITAEKEKVVFQEENGEKKEKVIMYTVWNETVANLTLLALGSSAPEILLSVVETINSLDKVPGELGPGTIVGSAAFNLLIITAICMWAVDEVRRIKEFGVFLITAAASIFAYVWMLVVLMFSSPDVIEVWEAVLTLLMFPMLVLFSYAQDRNWFCLGKEEDDDETAPPTGRGGEKADVENHDNPEPGRGYSGSRRGTKVLDAKFVECSEEEVRNIITAHKNRHGSVTDEELKDEIDKLIPHKKHNVNHYRMQTIRGMLSKSHSVLRRINDQRNNSSRVAPTPLERARLNVPDTGIAEFVSPSYSVLEGEGCVELRIRRHHGFSGKLSLGFKTSDLTAVGGAHYVASEGMLTFEDGETDDKVLRIGVIDNKERNADRHFTCRIEAVGDTSQAAVGEVNIALVTIIDDDLPGSVRFLEANTVVHECNEKVKIELLRENGGTGQLCVKYRTHDGVGKNAAVAPRDYEAQQGEVTFETGEINKTIEIPIVDRSLYDREDSFFVYLTAVEGKVGGSLGPLTKTTVTIVPDPKVAGLVQEVLNKAKEDRGHSNGDVSWGDQFREAMDIGGGEEPPSNFEYVMHFLTFLWKVLFALVPPAQWKGGWLCFCVSLFFIGLVTAMVAEIASLLGCVMGLKDSVTAITFVALGTSLPDTFASKQAAEQEDTADAAIGNVTGSNSVNVFLGLGLPWVLASIYYESKGECFIVPSGTLAFSVTIFTICAVVCLALLMVNRVVSGGELGGKYQKPLAVFMALMWLLYIIISSVQAYDHLPTFPGTENRCPCQCPNRGILSWAKAPADIPGSCIAAGCPVP